MSNVTLKLLSCCVLLATLSASTMPFITSSASESDNDPDRDRPDYPLTWAQYSGLSLQKRHGSSVASYMFTSISGDQILSPVYTFLTDSIVYWSEQDAALCVVQKNKPRRWLSLKDKIPDSINDSVVDVVSIFPYRKGIFVNLRTGDGRVGVFHVNAENGTVEPVIGAIEVRSSYDSDTYVYVDRDGNFKKRSLNKESYIKGIHLRPDDGNIHWDYVAKNDVLCLASMNRVSVFTKGHKYLWDAPDKSFRTVAIESSNNHLWFCSSKPHGMGSTLLCYSVRGKLLQERAADPYPMRLPISFASVQKQALISQLAPITRY